MNTRTPHDHSAAPESASQAKAYALPLAGFVPVTQPFMPPLEEFHAYLQEIWDNKWLTNNGPFHQRLEDQLCDYLGVAHLSLFSNATIALIIALQALEITGEVITTPFSFVATTHALQWNGIKPVFADIDPVSMNLDPVKIETAITPQTTALLPVHVYGNPCEVDRIETIAATYGLRVLYDAAHAFGVRIRGRSILEYGDMSVLSFHATKIFNTFEGGAIICRDEETKHRIDNLKNFGFVDETTVIAPGINGKMNEVQAAFGVLQLKYVDHTRERRARIDARYRAAFDGISELKMRPVREDCLTNYAYFPVFVTPEFSIDRDELYTKLRENKIAARRYFYPLISEFPSYRGLPSAGPLNLPVATTISRQVLCLPIFPALQEKEQERVIEVVLSCR
jgi:dTDP-4-amino-4,6-dideoxygalactose transaminase